MRTDRPLALPIPEEANCEEDSSRASTHPPLAPHWARGLADQAGDYLPDLA